MIILSGFAIVDCGWKNEVGQPHRNGMITLQIGAELARQRLSYCTGLSQMKQYNYWSTTLQWMLSLRLMMMMIMMKKLGFIVAVSLLFQTGVELEPEYPGVRPLKLFWRRLRLWALSVSSGLLCNFVAVYLTYMQFILQPKLCLYMIVDLLLEELTSSSAIAERPLCRVG